MIMSDLDKNREKEILAYIAEELDEQAMSKLKNNREMQEEMDDYKELWDKSGELSAFDKIDVEGDWRKVRARMGFAQRSKKIPFTKYMLRIAAILVLAFGLAYMFSNLIKQVPAGGQNEYFTEAAEAASKVVGLPDGTTVTLNKGSSIFYNNNFGEANRDVILEGEAFFNVSRNEELPFKVFASNSTVEVLGTSFNVKTVAEKVQLSVVSGKVAFFETANKENGVVLVRDEAVAFELKKQSFTNKTPVNTNDLAWRTKALNFRNTPLNEVFAAVALCFGLELENNTESELLAVTYTGNFSDKSVADIVYAIENSVDMPLYIKVTDTKLIVGK